MEQNLSGGILKAPKLRVDARVFREFRSAQGLWPASSLIHSRAGGATFGTHSGTPEREHGTCEFSHGTYLASEQNNLRDMNAAKILSLLAGLILTACGPAAEETQRQLLERISQKQNCEQQLKKTKAHILNADYAIKSYNGKVEAERVRLGRIEQWQIGRTPEERDQQIMDQSVLIQSLQDSVDIWSERKTHFEQEKMDWELQLVQYSDIKAQMEDAGIK